MRTLRILPIVAVLFAAAPASAQVSIWLQRGVSGWGFGMGVFLPEDATTVTVGGGYSYQGWIELDLTLAYTTFDEETLFGQFDVGQYGLSPSVQFHPLKQSKTMPISLALTAGFNWSFLDSDNFVGDEGGGAYGVNGGVSVYRFFRLAESFGIIPAAAFNVAWSNPYVTDEFGDDVDLDSLTGISLSVGAYVAYIDSGGRVWGIVPQVAIPLNDDAGDDPVFGITINLIFSQVPRNPDGSVAMAGR